ncbi:conserved hypothetical protein [Candidatus Koribacter versatilis Ellin345]|uniref:NAD/GMP synthase domain-containing protein n=1 Tax=Koribacter versatilis (strain Ellin345) TaxID=204669 RepID=Q1IVD6_KORVE|nr:ATP-dependent sacrificial sulfur transferase LarE [Candidatus Koribacter versatilis]ABF39164.1 conserved hypothetical protein [Candidatus Koribacter versatilis Ellin345]
MAVSPLPELSLEKKQQSLEAHLRSLGRLLVAYSGGIDSAYLAYVAHQVLGDNMLAILADSASLARAQMRDALAFGEEQSIPVQVVQTSEMDSPDYRRNDAMRCFHCKDELFAVMERVATEHGYSKVAYGVNLDDQGDFRPGQRAAKQHGVVAPLLDAAMTKSDIRELARQAGLRVWDKPASACLSSRIEYGRPVTTEALEQVEKGEDALRGLGFRQVRVRHHGQIARIEIAKDEIARAMTPEMAREFTRVFKALGFTYVTLDLEGFRSGSMNSLLPLEVLQKQ